MLIIIPLHRRLNRKNFPFVTFLLIVANIFVYAFLQTGETATEQRAVDYYAQTGLGDIEGPAYADWLRSHGGDQRKITFAQEGPAQARFVMIESDGKFLAELHAGRVIASSDPRYATWHQSRDAFEKILDASFNRSHEIRFSHVEPGRIAWAMFMHANFDHILGNMIFLAILGMLVEGALGPWWFLGLYLVGGFGSAFTSLWWHWGDEGLALGASGAIAALMGAYCVIWGLRKVRVFYWFLVLFDYVKVPALVVLPFWFGWQVLNLWLNKEDNVGFDAHAGGIAVGAAIAFALRGTGRVRGSFVEEDERIEALDRSEAEFEQAQLHLGRLEIPKARELLLRIDKVKPGQLRVLVALYRCARYRGTPSELDAASARVFAFVPLNDAQAREQKGVYEDYAKACAGATRLPPDVLIGLLPTLLRIGEDTAAENLLRDVGGRAPEAAGVAAAWLQVALRAPDGSAKRRERLQYLAARYPDSDFARKAQFLLGQA